MAPWKSISLGPPGSLCAPRALLVGLVLAAAPALADPPPPSADDDVTANRRVADKLRLGGPEGFMLQPWVSGTLLDLGLKAGGGGDPRAGLGLRVGAMWQNLSIDGSFGYYGTFTLDGPLYASNVFDLGFDVQPVLLRSDDGRTRFDLLVGLHLDVDDTLVHTTVGVGTMLAQVSSNSVAYGVGVPLGVGIHHFVTPGFAFGAEAGVRIGIGVGDSSGVSASLFANLVGTFVHRAAGAPGVAATPPPAQAPSRARAPVVIAAPSRSAFVPPAIAAPKNFCEAQQAVSQADAVVDSFREMVDAAGMGAAAAQGGRDVSEQVRATALAASGDASQRYLASVTTLAPHGDDVLRRAAEAAHKAYEDAAHRANDAAHDYAAQAANLQNLKRLTDRARVRVESAQADMGRFGAPATCPPPASCESRRAAADTALAVSAAFVEALADADQEYAAVKRAAEESGKERDAALRASQLASQQLLDSAAPGALAGDPALRKAAGEAHARYEDAARNAEANLGALFAEAATLDALKTGQERARLRAEDSRRRQADCQHGK